MTQKPTVDASKCTGCTLCSQVCFLGSTETGAGGKAAVVDDAACIACGHCVAICPVAAISHPDLGAIPLAPVSSADFDGLMGLLQMRRSRREFTDEPVSREDIQRLLSAAVQAPSAMNSQSVEFTVITDREVLRSLSKRAMRTIKKLAWLLTDPIGRVLLRVTHGRDGAAAMSRLAPEVKHIIEADRAGRDVILYEAPCAILVHSSQFSICGPENAIYCGANILLAAEAMGLAACVIGFVTEPAKQDAGILRIAGIPNDHLLRTTIIVGHPRFAYPRGVSKRPPKVHYTGRDL